MPLAIRPLATVYALVLLLASTWLVLPATASPQADDDAALAAVAPRVGQPIIDWVLRADAGLQQRLTTHNEAAERLLVAARHHLPAPETAALDATLAAYAEQHGPLRAFAVEGSVPTEGTRTHTFVNVQLGETTLTLRLTWHDGALLALHRTQPLTLADLLLSDAFAPMPAAATTGAYVQARTADAQRVFAALQQQDAEALHALLAPDRRDTGARDLLQMTAICHDAYGPMTVLEVHATIPLSERNAYTFATVRFGEEVRLVRLGWQGEHLFSLRLR